MSDISGWKYYFLTEQKKVSALVILVLILSFYLATFYLDSKVLIIFSFFVLLYFRDVFFPVRYEIDRKERRLTVKNFPFIKDHDLRRYVKVGRWKNGLFLSTMVKKSSIVRLFVKKNDIHEVEKVLNGCISAE